MGKGKGWFGEKERHSKAARKGKRNKGAYDCSCKKPPQAVRDAPERYDPSVDPNEKLRGHKLMTKELRKQLPPLYSQEDKKEEDILVPVKYFTPDSTWTWYVIEFDGEDLFFGLVDGFEAEMGYISLSELQNTRGPMGLPIERDLYWRPKTLSDVKKAVNARRRGVE